MNNTLALLFARIIKVAAIIVLIAGLLLVGFKTIAIIAFAVGLMIIICIEISQRMTLRAIRKVELPAKLPDQKIPLSLTVVDHTHCPGVLPRILGEFIQGKDTGVSCIIENLHPKLGVKELLVFVKRGGLVLEIVFLPARFLGELIDDKVLGIRRLLWFLSQKYSKA